MNDPVLESVREGHFVLWEEIARDGAQAKTLLSAQQRVDLARAHAAMFGSDGSSHLVFAAGFPSVCEEEFAAVRQVAQEVRECSVAVHARTTKADIELSLQALEDACHGRISVFFPTSERMSQALCGCDARETLRKSMEVIHWAIENAGNVAIDVAFADASRSEPDLMIEATQVLTDAGVRLIKLCDTVGSMLPGECYNMFRAVMQAAPAEVAIGAHLHNDYGLALANNLEAIRAGARIVAASWLGIAERNGLASTEQLLFLLGHPQAQVTERLGVSDALWKSPPDLRRIVPIASRVSALTGVPRKITDPISGTALNSISTGTPFTNPDLFQPFDPDEVLGVPRRVELTHLANRSVITAIASELGFELDEAGVKAALRWVKQRAFARCQAIVPRDEFAQFLSGLQIES